ncbi:uncharacterized protein EI90DRAFT_3032421 [Cantharellus anzutake]|uniref:uncharacterized protein n=1 Tax=Cantharellus anzutake TaxID=1750568 RepID=UPI001905CF2B|nr:uncharacterized protein EI90DRAFT_3032421 [Cantharellus anzutake]KAF8342192.1 hypothetical protein EI90DRAFT_3032421 [Cantharellus anzutake]
MPLSKDVETRGPLPGMQMKRAMVLRLSSETFAELSRAIAGGAGSGVPPIEVQFGDHEPSVLYIGGRRVDLTDLPESVFEIYRQRRTKGASGAGNPLELYGTVSSTLTAKRVLNEEVEGRLHQRTQQAEEDRTKRKAIYLDGAPDTLQTAKKRKVANSSTGSSLAKRALTQARTGAGPASAASSRPGSPLPPRHATTTSPSGIERASTPVASTASLSQGHGTSVASAPVAAPVQRRPVPKVVNRPADPPQVSADGFLTSSWKGGVKPKANTSASGSSRPAKSKVVKTPAIVPDNADAQVDGPTTKSVPERSSASTTPTRSSSTSSTNPARKMAVGEPLPSQLNRQATAIQPPPSASSSSSSASNPVVRKKRSASDSIDHDEDIAAAVNSMPTSKKSRPPVNYIDDELVAAAATTVSNGKGKGKLKAVVASPEDSELVAAALVSKVNGRPKKVATGVEDELEAAVASTSARPKKAPNTTASRASAEEDIAASTRAANNGKPKKKVGKKAETGDTPVRRKAPQPLYNDSTVQSVPPPLPPPTSKRVTATSKASRAAASSATPSRSSTVHASAGNTAPTIPHPPKSSPPPKRPKTTTRKMNGDARRASAMYTSSEESEKDVKPSTITHNVAPLSRKQMNGNGTTLSSSGTSSAPPNSTSPVHKRIPSAATNAPSPPPPPLAAKSKKKKEFVIPPLPPTTDRAALKAQYDKCYVPYSQLWARIVAERHRSEVLLKAIEEGLDDEGDSDDENTSSEEDVDALANSYGALHQRLLDIRSLLGG